MPVVDHAWEDEALEERWEKVLRFRQEVSKALEVARAQKRIGHGLDAWVRMAAPEPWGRFLESFPFSLRQLCIVSEVTIEECLEGKDLFESREIPGLAIEVDRARGEKCSRCWVYFPSVGTHASHPSVCTRCVEELKHIARWAEGDSR